MIQEIFKKISLTEDCIILDDDAIRQIGSIMNYKNVIQVNTEISLKKGVNELVLYVGIPDHSITLPKIFIKSESYKDLKFLPHINKDLSICIFDDELNHIYQESALPDIVEEMIHKAKKIIALYDQPEIQIVEFEREFKAYWEISYEKNDLVNGIGLSIIIDDSLPYKGYHFKNLLNGFKYLIYQECETFDKFKMYLNDRNFNYSEVEVFEIEWYDKKPPFNLSFSDSTKYIKESDLKRFKQTINKNGLQSCVIFFKNLKEEYFGWFYNQTIPPLSKLNRNLRRQISSWEILNSLTFSNSLVERISFSQFTPERLEKRTSGLALEKYKSICLIGLGSVGSNLLNFLIKLPIKKYHLIDSDFLKLENIYRHLCGFDKIGFSKVEAAKETIINKDPFCEVLLDSSSIIDVLNKNISLLDGYDLNIVVIGNTMTEKYILEHLIQTGCNKSLIMIWVEPYLASGQMMFICPNDFSKAKETILNFPYNVLNNSFISRVYLKEGSCQTGFFPYSEANLTLFLSAIYPYIFRLIEQDKYESSKVMSWIGNIEFIKEQGLVLSEFGISNKSFELIINEL
jgi:hypothetical protein